MSVIGNQEVDEDTPSAWLSFTVEDPDTPASQLIVEAVSSDPALVPPQNLVLAGIGKGRTLQVIPATNQWGSTFIILNVHSPSGGSASSGFSFTVRPVNDPPAFTDDLAPVAQVGQPYSWKVGIADPDPGDSLELTASQLPAWLSLDPATRVLSGVPGRGGPEGDVVELRLRDLVGGEVVKSFRIWTADNITVTNLAEIASRRQALIQYIWGDEGWPTNRGVVLWQPHFWDWYLGLNTDEGNLDRMDLYTCPLAVEAGLDSYIFHFVPKRGNGRLFVVHSGHFLGGFMNQDFASTENQPPGLVIPALLKEGYAVLAIDMPLYTCGNPLPKHVRLADGREVDLYSHDDLFKYFDRPFRYFVEPVVTTLNTLQGQYGYRHIFMTGLSGGGWTTTLCAALDPRIERSFPVAGSIPNYLRVGYEGLGDSEQDDPGLYRIANFEELYVMGSAGPNRLQLQILNLYDDNCFWGDRYTNWVGAVTAVVNGLGSGTYRFWSDDTHPGHLTSPAALARILAAVTPEVEAPARITVDSGAGEVSVPLTVSTGSLQQTGKVSVTVVPDESGLLTQATLDYGDSSPDATFRFQVASNAAGTATVHLRVCGDWSELATNLVDIEIVVRPPNLPPALALLSRPTGLVELGKPIGLEADAADGDGPIVAVEFWAGKTLLGSVAQAPYRLTWTNATEGRWGLHAVARDDRGGLTLSPAVTLDVEPTPSITHIQPTADGRVEIRVEGPDGYTLVTWASSGFTDWTPVSTNVLTDGVATILRPLRYPSRWYRVELCRTPP